jgi:hypothetical protein
MSAGKRPNLNSGEECARQRLLNIGFTRVESHPRGIHLPPDLLADGRIAVDVTRVGQRLRTAEKAGKAISLHESRLPFLANLENLLKKLRPPSVGSWHVSPWFRGPLPKWKSIRAKVRSSPGISCGRVEKGALEFHRTLTLDIWRAPGAPKQVRTLAGSIDREAGGFILREMHDSLT